MDGKKFLNYMYYKKLKTVKFYSPKMCNSSVFNKQKLFFSTNLCCSIMVYHVIIDKPTTRNMLTVQTCLQKNTTPILSSSINSDRFIKNEINLSLLSMYIYIFTVTWSSKVPIVRTIHKKMDWTDSVILSSPGWPSHCLVQY